MPLPVRARRTLFIVVAVVLGVAPAAAQNSERGQEPGASEPGTYAIRGLTIGAITGGVVGGLGLGVLASALCEQQDCDGVFLEGLAIGAAAGAAVGGLTGVIIGSAIRRGGGEDTLPDEEVDAPPASRDSSPLKLALSVGPGWGSGTRPDGQDIAVSVLLLANRPPPVGFGLEAGYLGRRQETRTFTLQCCGGGVATVEDDTRLMHASLVAIRSRPLQQGRGGAFLLGSAGVYSSSAERVTTGSSFLNGRRSDSEIYPGIGVGGGAAFDVGQKFGLGFDARFHGVIGQGDGLGTVFTVGGTLWRLR